MDITKRGTLILFSLLILAFPLTGCGDAKNLVDLALDAPKREPIDLTKVGVNNFFVDPEFGSIPQQYQEIQNTLGIKYVRILLAWTTDVQPTPESVPQYGLFDNVLGAIPPGVEVLVVLSHTPSWITDPKNWDGNNPRASWVSHWLKPTVKRYANNPAIVGFEIWNEPDLTVVPSDSTLGLENPDNYHELLSFSAQAVRANAPGKLVVLGATQSIQQNFPNNLRYNQRLLQLGADGLVDVWAIHYYGTRFESVVTTNGVADFLNSLKKTIWITESGERGADKQLAYVETAWPFLMGKVPAIERTYYYQFGETNTEAANSYGLRTMDPLFPVSDLYVYLRDSK